MTEINRRLYPKFNNPRYYGLVKLRKSIEQVLETYIIPNQDSSNKIALDLGCGTMPYKVLFEKHLKKYVGADIPENQSAELKIDLHSGRVDITDSYADYIISTQVLEHVESPTLYLQEAYRLCKNDGHLIISTHGFWMYHPNPNDYWRWTASGLKKTLFDNGWEVEKTVGIFGFAAAALCLLQDAIAIKLPKFLVTPYCFCMQQLIALADKFYTPKGREENAVLYVMVAKKRKSF